MIALVANPSEYPVISEFFELFKTPWEFYRQGGYYEIILCTAPERHFEENAAKLVLTYSCRPLLSEEGQPKQAPTLSYKGMRMPIYGNCVLFAKNAEEVLFEEETGQPASRIQIADRKMRVQIGYNLFGEIHTLLTAGQPLEYAGIPTLELHIALLRDLILASGAALAEIPPIPNGYPFMACLTHDVDHPSIRRHRFDHTMFGFLYRGIFGSLVDLIRGRASISHLRRNWIAVARLPLVYAGLANDFWHRFQDYPKLERGMPSSFFVIPFQGRPGQLGRGSAPSSRAAGYGAADITPQIRNLMAAGCEIGLHGIDAWCDSFCGREELEEIRRVTGAREIGVRMHWLYFDKESHRTLESAGATYDSTVGYNETVGYRAGTTQVFKPFTTSRMLELPLHVMDTALFYPGRLHLRASEAKKKVDFMINHLGQFGGVLTVNWHDRSICPERQWDRFYEELVQELNSKGAWFATAIQTVAWFRQRRSAVFETVTFANESVSVKVEVPKDESLPGLRLCIHRPRNLGKIPATGTCAYEGDININLEHSIDMCIPFVRSNDTNSATHTVA